MKTSKKAVVLLLVMALMLSLPSCKREQTDNNNEFPDVVTSGLPEDENIEEEITYGDFSVKLYSSYAVISEYTGKDSTVNVPASVNDKAVLSIGSYCFSGNQNIKEVVLPDGLRIIEKGAFEDCSALCSVTLPSSLERISDFAFRCTALEDVVIPDNVAYIGKYAFYLTHIENVVIPSRVSVVEKYAFYGIRELKTVKLSERLCEIGERAFGGCSSLETVEMYSNVSKFGDYCFSDCRSLKSLNIPSSAETFGSAAFNGCSELTLYVAKNSAAAKYAEKNNYKYEISKD